MKNNKLKIERAWLFQFLKDLQEEKPSVDELLEELEDLAADVAYHSHAQYVEHYIGDIVRSIKNLQKSLIEYNK